DCKSIVGEDGTQLSGDMAARLLDLAGITCNRNTLPGDDSAARPSGVRLGTPWITQRGFREPEIDSLAEIIANVLKAAKPFSYGKGGKADARARIDFDTLTSARQAVDKLCTEAGIDYELPVVGTKPPVSGRSHFVTGVDAVLQDRPDVIEIRGPEAERFLY